MARLLMPIRTWIILVVGVFLLAGTILWSTGRLSLPYPFASLGTIPDRASGRAGGAYAIPGGQGRGVEFRRQLVSSILRDRMVTVTVHVALCDSSKSKVNSPDLGLGNNPAKNLYWGAKNGVRRFFNDRSEWELIGADPGRSVRYVLQRVVFIRKVKPTPEWRQRGVTKPFQICMLAVAWAGPAAGDAMRAVFRDALNLQPPTEVRVGERTLRFGSGSNLIGYVGFNAVKEDSSILPDPGESIPRPAPRGVFFITPSSAQTVGSTLRDLGLHPVLLTTDYITPEAYVLYGLTEALAQGRIEKGFSLNAAELYAKFQRLEPEATYTLFIP